MADLPRKAQVKAAWNRRKAVPDFQPVDWLTEEKLESIRADAMADDVDIDMAALCLRSEADALRFFEDGGEVPEVENTISTWLNANVPNAAHRRKLDEALRQAFPSLRGVLRMLALHEAADDGVAELLALLGDSVPAPEAKFIAKALLPLHKLATPVPASAWATDEAAFATFLRSRLDGIGWGAPLAWETAAQLFVPRKPTAVVRLFCLGGISEVSASFHSLVAASPRWLEVRPLELPGHGFREELSGPSGVVMGAGALEAPIALGSIGPLREARERTACELVDELEPLLRDGAPYALYGFSLGAMMVYLMVVELQRRGLPAPLVLLVAGRGAPHLAKVDDAFYLTHAALDDDAILDQVAATMFDVRRQTADLARRKPLVAQRWRLGQIFAQMHVGECDAGTPALPQLAAGAPRVRCPTVTLNSDVDELWAQEDFGHWEALVEAAEAVEATGAPRACAKLTIRGVPHFELVASPEMQQGIFEAMAAAVAGLAAKGGAP